MIDRTTGLSDIFDCHIPESMLKTDMKGILAGCTDMLVIDDDEEDDANSKPTKGRKKRKSGRKKSLKLQKQEVKEENSDEKPPVEPVSKSTGITVHDCIVKFSGYCRLRLILVNKKGFIEERY